MLDGFWQRTRGGATGCCNKQALALMVLLAQGAVGMLNVLAGEDGGYHTEVHQGKDAQQKTHCLPHGAGAMLIESQGGKMHLAMLSLVW